MAPVQLTAVITPKPGKAARFLELFEDCVQYVKENEPYVHRYELHKGISHLNDGKEQFIVLEGYDDQDAMERHLKTLPVVRMVEILEKEQLVDIQIIRTNLGYSIKSRI